MKYTLLITSLAATALVVGCSKRETTQAQPAGSVAQSVAKAQTAATDAAQQMKEYTFAQRTEFVASMQTQLTALNLNLDELSARIAKSSDSVKAEATPKLAALREQSAKMQKQLADLSGATSSTWAGLKADAEKSYAALKDGIASSRQWVSEKIAP